MVYKTNLNALTLNALPFDPISKNLSLLVKELLNVVLWVTSDAAMILCILSSALLPVSREAGGSCTASSASLHQLQLWVWTGAVLEPEVGVLVCSHPAPVLPADKVVATQVMR